MKQYTLFATGIIVSIMYLMSSCADKLSEPVPSVNSINCDSTRITYNDHVQRIVNAQCNFSGCHDDNARPSFGAYSTMNAAQRMAIYTRVCVSKDMPPSGPSQATIDTINCWQSSGYLEN